MKSWYFKIKSDLSNTSNMGAGYNREEYISLDAATFEDAYKMAYDYGFKKFGEPKNGSDIAWNADNEMKSWIVVPITKWVFDKKK